MAQTPNSFGTTPRPRVTQKRRADKVVSCLTTVSHPDPEPMGDRCLLHRTDRELALAGNVPEPHTDFMGTPQTQPSLSHGNHKARSRPGSRGPVFPKRPKPPRIGTALRDTHERDVGKVNRTRRRGTAFRYSCFGPRSANMTSFAVPAMGLAAIVGGGSV